MKKAGLILAGMFIGVFTFAQNWVPATGGSWTNTANWSTAIVPDSASAQVFVTNNFAAAPTLTLDRSAAFTINKISYNDVVTPYVSGTLSAGSPAGSLIFAGTTPTVDTPAAAANGADLTISAPVNVSLGLTKTGARNAYLTGAVTGFGSGVYNNVNAGMLAIGTATPINWTVINKTSGIGVLRLDALTTLTAPATFSVGAGELSLNPASGTFSFDAAGFTKTGAGVLSLNRNATGPGGSATLQVNGGTLRFTTSLSGFASGTVASGSTLQFMAANTSTLNVSVPLTLNGNGAVYSMEFPANNTDTYNLIGVALSGNVIIRSYGLINTYNYNSALTGNSTTSLLFRTEGGNSSGQPHTIVLNAACTYTGSTTLSTLSQQGIIKLGVADALPTTTSLTLTGGGNVNTSASLELNGYNQTLSGLIATVTTGGSKVINSSGTAATLTVSNSTANTMAGKLGGGATGNNFALIKRGSGTLTLSGANTYTGATTVTGGTLLVNNTNSSATVTVNSGATLSGSGPILGNVTVNSNGTLNCSGLIQGTVSAAAGAVLLPGGSAVVGTMTLTNALTLNGSALFIDVTSSTNDLIATAGALILEGANTVTLNLLNGSLPAGVYTLMTYASQSGSGTLALDPACRNATLAVGATSVTLTVSGSGSGVNLTWVGGSGNPWDINSSTFWDNGSGADVFFNLDNVLFNDSGSASPAVDITTAVLPTSVVVSNVVNAYTFSGSGAIAGASTLTKLGTNTLTLANVNTYSGATTVKAGRLAYGINDAIGAGAVSITNATVLLGAYTDTVGTITVEVGGQITGTSGSLATTSSLELRGGTVSAVIAGAGAVNMPTNTSTLSGANTYTGPTTVGSYGVPGVVLNVNHPNALGSTNIGTTVFGGNGTTENKVVLASGVTVTNETLTLDGGAGYRAAVRLSAAGTATWHGNVLLAGTATYFGADNSGGTFYIGLGPETTVTGSPSSHSIRGGGTVIVNSRISIGATTINRDDAGTFIINSPNNVWGATSINQGTLKLGVSDAMPANTALSIGKGGAVAAAALDLNGKSQTVASLVELHNTTGTQKILSAAPATLTVNNAAANSFGTTGSSIEGWVSLVKTGAGTLTLTGTNTTYGGFTVNVSNGTLVVSGTGMLGNSTNITVTAGTLTLQNSACITNTAALRIANGGGAKVNLAAGVNETVGTLWFGDLQKGAGTYGATGSGAGVINDAHFSGLGILTVLRGNVGTMIFLQ